MKKSCICILNYNNGPKTVRCISSVLDQTLSNHRIVIVDNNSTDDSLRIIQDFLLESKLPFRFCDPTQEFRDVLPDSGEIFIIRSATNGGYSSGNNLGIKLAKSMNIFNYLLIINNDVVLEPNFLEEMIKRYEYLHEIKGLNRIALGAIELGRSGKMIHHGFHFLHLPSGITFASSCFPSLKYIVGSAIFVDIDAPLMDESFFLYFDDIQYSKELSSRGYLLEKSPHSRLTHEVGGTFKEDVQWLIFKSMFRFYRLNYPFLLPLVVPIRILLILYLRVKSMIKRMNHVY
ncbi:MAG: glycosyltransferase family 2 protein [Bacteroidota bacterium]